MTLHHKRSALYSITLLVLSHVLLFLGLANAIAVPGGVDYQNGGSRRIIQRDVPGGNNSSENSSLSDPRQTSSTTQDKGEPTSTSQSTKEPPSSETTRESTLSTTEVSTTNPTMSSMSTVKPTETSPASTKENFPSSTTTSVSAEPATTTTTTITSSSVIVTHTTTKIHSTEKPSTLQPTTTMAPPHTTTTSLFSTPDSQTSIVTSTTSMTDVNSTPYTPPFSNTILQPTETPASLPPHASDGTSVSPPSGWTTTQFADPSRTRTTSPDDSTATRSFSVTSSTATPSLVLGQKECANDPHSVDQRCPNQYFCNAATHQCVLLLPQDAHCYEDFQCASSYCDNNRQCGAPPTAKNGTALSGSQIAGITLGVIFAVVLILLGLYRWQRHVRRVNARVTRFREQQERQDTNDNDRQSKFQFLTQVLGSRSHNATMQARSSSPSVTESRNLASPSQFTNSYYTTAAEAEMNRMRRPLDDRTAASVALEIGSTSSVDQFSSIASTYDSHQTSSSVLHSSVGSSTYSGASVFAQRAPQAIPGAGDKHAADQAWGAPQSHSLISAATMDMADTLMKSPISSNTGWSRSQVIPPRSRLRRPQ